MRRRVPIEQPAPQPQAVPARRRVMVRAPAIEPVAPARRGLVNAFTSNDALVLVDADGSMKRRPAKLSCYIRGEDATADVMRLLRQSRGVLAIENEGGWVRVDWRDYDWRRRGIEALASDRMRDASGKPMPPVQTYEGDVSAVLRFLVDEQPEIAQPRPVYLDIEVDSRQPISQHVAGRARVLCWALVDDQQRVVAARVLADDTHESERALLTELWLALGDYDQVRSWNGDGYDFPVIANRSKELGIRVQVRRWLWLDHLEQFKRANMMAAESGEEKQSYALGAIAHAILGESKHDFDSGKTWEAWEAGGAERKRLLDYCIQDAILMPRIEAETGYCALLGTIAEVCGIFADSRAVNPQTQVEALLMRLYHTRGMRPATKQYDDRAPREQFAGAYVMDPRGAGIRRDVHVCDFAGMYPSIIRSFNISPETRVPWPDDPNKCRPSYLPAVPFDLEQMVPEGCACAPLTKVYFDQSVEGILPQAIAEMVRLRAEWNKKKAALPPNSAAWKEADRRTTAYKIAANSFYGVVGAPTSRFFDPASAEAVTQVGKWLLLETMKAAEARGMQVIYGDTDSLYVVGCTKDEFARFVDACNAELYPRILAERGAAKNFVKLDYEKAYSRLVFSCDDKGRGRAKNYCGRFAHYKGTKPEADAKPEIKGLAYKRGDALRLTREMQLEAILLVCREESEPTAEEGHELVERWKQRVLAGELELADVVHAKSLSKELHEYRAKMKKDGTASAQPAHVQVAHVLKKRGHRVQEGTKIAYICIDGSASPKRYIPAEDFDGAVDRYDLWETDVYPPTRRLLQGAFAAAGWDRHQKVRPAKVRARVVPPSRATATAKAREAAGQAMLFAPLSAKS